VPRATPRAAPPAAKVPRLVEPARLAEPDPALLDSLLPTLEAALAPLNDARLALTESLGAIERLSGSSSDMSAVGLRQLRVQLETAARRLGELRQRIAPEPPRENGAAEKEKSSAAGRAGRANGAAGDKTNGPAVAKGAAVECGETLLGKLCVLAAAHCATHGGSDGTATRGGSSELPAVSCAVSSGELKEASGMVRWGALSGLAIYGRKMGLKGSGAKGVGGLRGAKGARGPGLKAKQPSKLVRISSAGKASAALADGTSRARAEGAGSAGAGGSGSGGVTIARPPSREPTPASSGGKSAAPSGKPTANGKAPAPAPSGGKAAALSSKPPANGKAAAAGPSGLKPRAREPPAHFPSRDSSPAGKKRRLTAAEPVNGYKFSLASLPRDDVRMRVTPSALRLMLSMGYEREFAEHALRRVGGANVELAIALLADE